MDNSVKDRIETMIRQFNDDLAVNEIIIESIEKLDKTVKELKNKLNDSQKAMEKMIGLAKTNEFKDGVYESLADIRRTNEILQRVNHTMGIIENTQEQFNKNNENIRKEYNKIYFTNEEKRQILEELKNTSISIKELVKQNAKDKEKIDNISDDIKEIKKIVLHKKDENENKISKVLEKISDYDKKIDELLLNQRNINEGQNIKVIKNTNQNEEFIIQLGNEVEIIEEIIIQLVNEVEIIKEYVKEDNEKITKNQTEIKEQLKNMEESLALTIGYQIEEIFEEKVKSVFRRMLSGIED